MRSKAVCKKPLIFQELPAPRGHTGKSLVVLVSAGIELIFFLVAGMMLCFGFSKRITLITH